MRDGATLGRSIPNSPSATVKGAGYVRGYLLGWVVVISVSVFTGLVVIVVLVLVDEFGLIGILLASPLATAIQILAGQLMRFNHNGENYTGAADWRFAGATHVCEVPARHRNGTAGAGAE